MRVAPHIIVRVCDIQHEYSYNGYTHITDHQDYTYNNTFPSRPY